jgi:hypothetical protein
MPTVDTVEDAGHGHIRSFRPRAAQPGRRAGTVDLEPGRELPADGERQHPDHRDDRNAGGVANAPCRLLESPALTSSWARTPTSRIFRPCREQSEYAAFFTKIHDATLQAGEIPRGDDVRAYASTGQTAKWPARRRGLQDVLHGAVVRRVSTAGGAPGANPPRSHEARSKTKFVAGYRALGTACSQTAVTSRPAPSSPSRFPDEIH